MPKQASSITSSKALFASAAEPMLQRTVPKDHPPYDLSRHRKPPSEFFQPSGSSLPLHNPDFARAN